MNVRYLSCLAALSLSGASPAIAQEFFGLQHTPLGDADLVMTPDGLEIRNLGATGLDGVDVHIPPPEDVTRQGIFVHVQGLRLFALDTALELSCSGADASGVPGTSCSMTFEHSSGVPTVSFDFAAIQPASVRVVYYSHGTVLAEEILPSPVSGPFALTGSPVELDPGLVNGFSAHFDWTSHSWIFDWTWDTSRLAPLGGGGDLLGVDHVEVHAENVTNAFTSFDSIAMTIDGPPEVTITHELLENIQQPCPCDFAPPFGQLDFSDVVGFLQCFTNACP